MAKSKDLFNSNQKHSLPLALANGSMIQPVGALAKIDFTNAPLDANSHAMYLFFKKFQIN